MTPEPRRSTARVWLGTETRSALRARKRFETESYDQVLQRLLADD